MQVPTIQTLHMSHPDVRTPNGAYSHQLLGVQVHRNLTREGYLGPYTNFLSWKL